MNILESVVRHRLRKLLSSLPENRRLGYTLYFGKEFTIAQEKREIKIFTKTFWQVLEKIS